MMNRKGAWITVPVFTVLLASAGLLLADREGHDDDDAGVESYFAQWMTPDRIEKNGQYSKLYREECGSCHFPFQAAFLPVHSWQAIMQGLDDHYGDNAELSDELTLQITDYLVNNAAGRIDREIPHKVLYSLRFTPNPMRVTETAFFQHEHREIPPRILRQGDTELSFANCDSCHPRALEGYYNEDDVRIPGVGRWDD